MQNRINQIKDRTRILAIIPATGHEVNQIKVQLRFNSGGINYANYKHEDRGYYLSVQPEFYEEDGCFSSTMIKAFSGIKQLIEHANRFGKAKLAKIDVDQAIIDALVSHVVVSNSLTITKEDIAA